jgi:hypothetical protein
VGGGGTRLCRTRPYPARPYRTRLYHPAGMQPGGLDRVLYIQIAWLAEACSPPPPRAPISRFCITRKEYVSARPFVGGPSLREDHSSRKLRSSPEGDGLGLRPGNSRRPVGTRSRRGLPRAWAASTQAPTPRPGPQGPVRPRGARCRPSRDAATAFIPERRPRRPWAAADRAISPRG